MSIVQSSKNKQKEKEILYTTLTTGITPLSHGPDRARDHKLHPSTTVHPPHSSLQMQPLHPPPRHRNSTTITVPMPMSTLISTPI